MSNYVKSTDFAAKDALASGNAGKIVKGTEIDTEFNNIATAVATKADLASPTFTGTPSLPSGTTAVTQTSTDSSTKLATTAFVQSVLGVLYPVGSVYINATSSTNPGTLLGFGTWTAFGAGRTLVGLNASDSSFDTAEETGGSKDAIAVSHTHTATSTSTVTDPGHLHNSFGTTGGSFGTGLLQPSQGASSGNYSTASASTGVSVATSTSVSTAGSSGTNANLPPYIVVYMWKRTA
jgi:hypothetical protein